MDAQELKKYIHENNYVDDILNKLECHHIRPYNTEYRAGLPNRTYGNSIVIKRDEYLNTRVYTSEKTIQGDIFTLVMLLKNKNFPQSVRWLHKVLSLPYTYSLEDKSEKKKDPLKIFKKIIKNENKEIDKRSLIVYDKNILKNMVLIPSLTFFREGISIQTQEKFEIGYSTERERIGIPHKYWQNGRYLGIIGRTTIPNYDDFNIAKYLPITNPFFKSLNLYGLAENYKHIQEKGYVIVFEGEKSVMKLDTWKLCNGVAVGCHEISEEQRRILIGLNVEIVIAFDKDVEQEHMIYECRKFKGIRPVSYIYDKFDLLDEKDSPCDKGIKVWNYLLKYRIYI